MTGSWIYLIEAESGLVKIGRAAFVRDRVTTVRTHSPVRIRLIATWPGAEPEEAELHRRFADQRRHGEWFEIAGDLAAFVNTVRGKNTPDIPAWDELTFDAHRSFGQRRGSVARDLIKHRRPSVLYGGLSA